MAVQRRNFRERKDCLGEYSNAELIRRFRLDLNGINFVEGLIRHSIRVIKESCPHINPESFKDFEVSRNW